MIRFALRAHFSLRTRQATIIRDTPNIKKSREQLQVEIEDPHRVEHQKQMQREQQIKEYQQYIFNLKSNDKNPANFVKVQFLNPNSLQQNTSPTLPIIVPKQPKQEKTLIYGIRRKIPASLKKLWPLCKNLIGQHLYQAQADIQQSRRKAARFILSALNMVRAHAVQRGYDEERLYVQSIITGKYRRFRKLRYHAKAKMSQAHRDTCQIRVTLEEKPAKEMFKEFLQGKVPEQISRQVKSHLLDDSSYGKIRELQFMLTAKGRQQSRLMIKRRVQQELQNNKSLSYKYIEDRIMNEEADKLVDAYERNKQGAQKVSLEQRQSLFKKNEELNN